MAYNAIASGSAILTTNADGLKSGLDQAARDVQGWGKKVEGSLGKGASGGKGGGLMGSLFGGAGGALGKAGPAALAATAAVAGFSLATKEVIDTLGDLAKEGDMAQALGLTAEQFTGMSGIAKSVGGDTREFIESLVTMGKLGTDAAKGTEEAAAAMKALGLNADEFIKLRADQQFFAVFDSLGRMTDPLQRTRALMAAFGEDGGKNLLPLLKKTPAELQKMAAGFAVSAEEMKKAQAASAAVKGLQQAAGRLWRGVAVAAAPLVEWFAGFATKALDWLRPVFDWFGRAWQAVEDTAGPILAMIGDAVAGAFRDMKEWAADGFSWVGELPTIREVIVATFRATGVGAALAWDTIKSGAAVVSIAAGGIVKAFGEVIGAFRAVVSLAEELPDEMIPDDLKAFISGVKGFEGDVDKVGQGMIDWGKKAALGWGNSAIEFDKWLDDAIKPKEKGAEAGKAFADAMKDELAPVKLSAAISAGSKEAYSLVVKNQLRGQGLEIEGVAKKHLAEAKKGNKALAEGNKNTAKIADKLDSLGSF